MNDTASVNGDMRRAVAVDTASMDWQPSPSGSVWRKRLHRVGPAESGQVTSVVRYRAGATFPAHDHPEGEEILVLDGVFCDEHGDWPAGTYQLNPEGFRHAPFSREGCTLFVKLRQYAGEERVHVALDTGALAWLPATEPGIDVKELYLDERFPERIGLQRWAPGARSGAGAYADGAELFVIDGDLGDDDAQYGAGTWLRLPVAASTRLHSRKGCVVYVKTGAIAALRGDD